MNALCLSIRDYGDPDSDTKLNQILDIADIIFTVIYSLEAVIKVVALGFVIHINSYLRDPWNVLDFVVVIIGFLAILPSIPNLKALRTMRVLRPLRSVKAIPSLKRLVASLLLSIP
jgi:hypothetical protein